MKYFKLFFSKLKYQHQRMITANCYSIPTEMNFPVNAYLLNTIIKDFQTVRNV